MALNVNPSFSSGGARDQLLEDVLSEFNQISFRDFQGALRSWHEGTLSLVHLNVLMLLRFSGPQTMSRLADLLDVSVASATGIVDRMEKKGVVERRRNDEDRRVVEVHLTERGEKVFILMQAERQARMRRMLSEIADTDLVSLRDGLRAVRVARDRVLNDSEPEPHQA